MKLGKLNFRFDWWAGWHTVEFQVLLTVFPKGRWWHLSGKDCPKQQWQQPETTAMLRIAFWRWVLTTEWNWERTGFNPNEPALSARQTGIGA